MITNEILRKPRTLTRSSPSAASIEIIRPLTNIGRIRFALFDFDGTLSLIREGWQAVMIPYFVEEIEKCPRSECRKEVEKVVRDFVEKLTGKQTIYQCFQLIDEINRRGGNPRGALDYKHEYLRRLDERIQHRLEGLSRGTIAPDCLLLPGSRQILEMLQSCGIHLALASGTDLHYVESEAETLQIAQYFGERIYGALDRYEEFSKQMIIERLMEENRLAGPELLIIGDGYVEILNGKASGCPTVGVASDEACPGNIDPWKRARLIDAGADLIIADYRAPEALARTIGIAC